MQFKADSQKRNQKKQISIPPAIPMQRMQIHFHNKQIKKHNLPNNNNPKSHFNIQLRPHFAADKRKTQSASHAASNLLMAQQIQGNLHLCKIKKAGNKAIQAKKYHIQKTIETPASLFVSDPQSKIGVIIQRRAKQKISANKRILKQNPDGKISAPHIQQRAFGRARNRIKAEQQ